MTYRGYKILLTLVLGVAMALIGPLSLADDKSSLSGLLNQGGLSDFYPGADRLSMLEDSETIVRAESGGKTLGYLFINSDFVDSTGYSGKPIDVLVAVDKNGIIQNVKLLQHFEPIVLAGIPESRIVAFVEHLTGLDLAELLKQKGRSRSVDAVSGATVTTRVIDDSVPLSIQSGKTTRFGSGRKLYAGGQETGWHRQSRNDRNTGLDRPGCQSIGYPT